jgi:hypothetical protein
MCIMMYVDNQIYSGDSPINRFGELARSGHTNVNRPMIALHRRRDAFVFKSEMIRFPSSTEITLLFFISHRNNI